MIRIHSENGSDSSIAPVLAPFAQRSLSAARRAGVTTTNLSRRLLHTRAVLRLARRRPQLALGLFIALGSAITSAAATASVVVHQVQLHTAVQPLAPAPAPPAPPQVKVKRHPFLALGNIAINPLHGLASWYGDVWNGRKTASGETFDDTKMTAAHKTLPLGTIVRVTNLRSRRTVVVRINDRGTLRPHRVIDLSSAAARELGMVEQGLANVKLEVIGRS